MSRGTVDVVLYEIDRTDDSLAAFADDPVGFVAGYPLTDEERRAFETWDYATLYALGAHPFLLFQAVRSLAVERGQPLDELLAEYRAAVTPHGYPDFIT